MEKAQRLGAGMREVKGIGEGGPPDAGPSGAEGSSGGGADSEEGGSEEPWEAQSEGEAGEAIA